MSTSRKHSWQYPDPRRRAGLTRRPVNVSLHGHKTSSTQCLAGMPKLNPSVGLKSRERPSSLPKEKKQELAEDEDYTRLPVSPSDSPSSDSENSSANIQKTKFEAGKANNFLGLKGIGYGGSRFATKASNQTSSRSTRSTDYNILKKSGHSPKRKSPGVSAEPGSRIRSVTEFDGTKKPKKQKIAAYSSSQAKYGSSKSSQSAKATKSTPVKQFARPPRSDCDDDATISPPKSPLGFKAPPKEASESPERLAVPKQNYINPDIQEDSPLKDTSSNIPKFRSFTLDDSDSDMPRVKLSTKRRRRKKSNLEDIPTTQIPKFIPIEIPDEIGGLMSQDVVMLRSRISLDADFDILSQSRCPMCHAPVDEGLLKKAGNMNTRQQEKFCRSHQRDTAKALWREKDYPDIDFEALSSRILRHHDFIQNLIQGQDCHFRQVLDDAVKGGTDRTLLKSTRNLTPGYYGSRGLKIISEHIMRQFTPLLKRVAVTDNLMIARGVTPFVQLVLVPEVTILLIKEDLDVGEARARAVLTESASLGEIMHEESKDVVHIAESDVEENIDIG